jgi:hypothetical protein
VGVTAQQQRDIGEHGRNSMTSILTADCAGGPAASDQSPHCAQRERFDAQIASTSAWGRSGLRAIAAAAALGGVLAGGCGGGTDAAANDVTAVGARQLTSAAICSVPQVMVAVERVRFRTAAGTWVDYPLSAPQFVNLRSGSPALLRSIGLGDLPAGDYSEMRLVLADADGSSYVQDGNGTTAPLMVPSGSTSGIKIKDAVHVPAGNVADLSLAGIDPCTVRMNGLGHYILNPVLDVQVAAVLAPPAPPPAEGGPQLPLSTAGALTALPGGGFISVLGATGSTWTVQRVSASGSAGPVVTVQTPAPGIGGATFVALQGGGFAAVWVGDMLVFARFGGETFALMMQSYTDAGVPLGSPVQIGTTQPMDRWIGAPAAPPVATPLLGGGFAVAWVNSTTAGLSLLVQRFNADGTAASPAQVAAPDVSGYLGIGALTTGGYMVTWNSGARAYSASDLPVGPPQPVGPRWPGTGPAQFVGSPPSIASLAGGGAVVVWTSLVAMDAKAQHLPLAPDAAALATPAVVDGSGPFDPPPVAPAAAGLRDGSYVVVWVNGGIQARRFASNGAPLGPVTRIDLSGNGPVASPAVTATSDGGFVVAWTGAGADGVVRDYMRAFSSAGLLPV